MTMTPNEEIAYRFLNRFLVFTVRDVVELAAMLDTAEEEGAAKSIEDRFEKTQPGVDSDEDPFERTQPDMPNPELIAAASTDL